MSSRFFRPNPEISDELYPMATWGQFKKFHPVEYCFINMKRKHVWKNMTSDLGICDQLRPSDKLNCGPWVKQYLQLSIFLSVCILWLTNASIMTRSCLLWDWRWVSSWIWSSASAMGNSVRCHSLLATDPGLNDLTELSTWSHTVLLSQSFSYLIMLLRAKGTFFFSVSGQHGPSSTSRRSVIERWCSVKVYAIVLQELCWMIKQWDGLQPVLNGLSPLVCSKSGPPCFIVVSHWKRRLLGQSGQLRQYLLVPVGHSVFRAVSTTCCCTAFNLPNHLASFTFLAWSHTTNMLSCPDYPYRFAKQFSVALYHLSLRDYTHTEIFLSKCFGNRVRSQVAKSSIVPATQSSSDHAPRRFPDCRYALLGLA